MKIHIKGAKLVNNRSNYKRRMHILLCVFGILSILIIPIFTLFLAINGNPFTTPLSTIGNRPGMRGLFLFWTATMSAYYSGLVFTLIILTKNTRAKLLRWLILVSTWILLVTNLVPFLPDRFPILARIHSNGAKISVLLLSFTLLFFTISFRNFYPKLFKKTLAFLICFLFGMLQLYLFFSSSWITEASSVVGSSIFLFTVLFWLYKENNFDAEDVLHSYDINLAEKEIKRLESRAKQAYDEYIKFNELSRIALMEFQELKKINK